MKEKENDSEPRTGRHQAHLFILFLLLDGRSTLTFFLPSLRALAQGIFLQAVGHARKEERNIRRNHTLGGIKSASENNNSQDATRTQIRDGTNVIPA